MADRYAFVVLHYGQSDMTKACVASLLALEGAEATVGVVVVDNGSPDGSGPALKKFWAHEDAVSVVLMGENAGFSKANNVGYRKAVERFSPRAVCVLNNDTEIREANFLALLAEDLEEERFYVVGPDVFVERKGMHQSPILKGVLTAEQVRRRQRNIGSPADWVVNFLLHCGDRFSPVRPLVAPLRAKTEPERSWQARCEGELTLHGAALVFTDLFIATGEDPFSPEVFLYREENILAKRCQDNGWPMLYDPRLQVIHFDDGSTNAAFTEFRARRHFLVENEQASLAVLAGMYDRG